MNLILLVTLVVFTALPQLLFMGKVDKNIEVDAKKGLSSSGHLMDEMDLKLYKDNRLEWKLDANQAESFEDGVWGLFQVKGSFNQEKSSKINFIGDRGSVDLNHKFVSLEGDVNAESVDGYTFETATLNIRSDKSEGDYFYSNDRVKIYNTSEDLEVLSTGILGNTKTGEVELLSEVSCQKSVKQYKDILIKSDSAFFTSSLKGIRFRENLRISQADFNIKGEEAYFLYDEASKNLKSVQIDGDILASDGVKTALSERVEMRTEEDVIIFQGNPRVRVGKNEMIGDEILITNKQKNIQVIRGNIKSTKEGAGLSE